MNEKNWRNEEEKWLLILLVVSIVGAILTIVIYDQTYRYLVTIPNLAEWKMIALVSAFVIWLVVFFFAWAYCGERFRKAAVWWE